MFGGRPPLARAAPNVGDRDPGPMFIAIALVFILIVLLTPSCAYITTPY